MHPAPSSDEPQTPDRPADESALAKQLDGKRVSPKVAWILGTVLTTFFMIVFFLARCLSPDQRGILRFLMALAGSLLAVCFVGGIVLKGRVQGLIISAAGGVAIFVLIFVINPLPSTVCGDSGKVKPDAPTPTPTVAASVSPTPINPLKQRVTIRLSKPVMDDFEQQISKLKALIAAAEKMEAGDADGRRAQYADWKRDCGSTLEKIDQVEHILSVNTNLKTGFDTISTIDEQNNSGAQLDKMRLEKLKAGGNYLKDALASLQR